MVDSSRGTDPLIGGFRAVRVLNATDTEGGLDERQHAILTDALEHVERLSHLIETDEITGLELLAPAPEKDVIVSKKEAGMRALVTEDPPEEEEELLAMIPVVKEELQSVLDDGHIYQDSLENTRIFYKKIRDISLKTTETLFQDEETGVLWSDQDLEKTL